MKEFLGTICAILIFALFSGFGSDKSSKIDNSTEKTVVTKSNLNFESYANNFYNASGLGKSGLSKEAFDQAITGYYAIMADPSNNLRVPILTIIDYTKKSVEKRMWVVDMVHSNLLYNTLVAHGKNSGEQYAEHFSNDCASNMSSLGFFLTGEIYNGKHGKSLILNGLEQGFNDHAKERSIVMHAADYVSEDFIQKVGRIGRSQGCPAIPDYIAPQIIDAIANGSCLFVYYPDKHYNEATRLLDIKTAEASFSKGLRSKGQ